MTRTAIILAAIALLSATPADAGHYAGTRRTQPGPSFYYGERVPFWRTPLPNRGRLLAPALPPPVIIVPDPAFPPTRPSPR
jgi:hypothetical protein